MLVLDGSYGHHYQSSDQNNHYNGKSSRYTTDNTSIELILYKRIKNDYVIIYLRLEDISIVDVHQYCACRRVKGIYYSIAAMVVV